MPNEVRAGNLLVKAGGRLKDNRIGEDHHASGGLAVCSASTQLHQMQANKTDVNDVPGDTGDLDAVANFDSVASDQEEVTGDCKNDILQSDSNAGRNQSRECRQ